MQNITEINTGIMVALVAQLAEVAGDKPATHEVAQRIAKLAKEMASDTRPGVADFKWSAKARKDLLAGRMFLTHMTDETGVTMAHSNGYWLKMGTPSKRFDPIGRQDMPFDNIKRIAPTRDESQVATIAKDGAEIVLSTGTKINRTYLEYVMTDAVDPVIYCAGTLKAVTVYDGDTLVGLVMPIRQ